MGRQCAYTHQTGSNRFANIDGDRWRCPRDAADGDRCPFHDPDVTDSAILEDMLYESISTTHGPVRVIGGRFGDLSLDYAILDGRSNHPIDLRDAVVSGRLSARHATINRPLDLRGARVESKVDFEDAQFNWRVDLGSAEVGGRLSLRLIDAESWFDIGGLVVEGETIMRVARLQRGIYAEEATFRGAADFVNVTFGDVANFYESTFDTGAVFEDATFSADARFDYCHFQSPTVRLSSVSDSSLGTAREVDDVAVLSKGARYDGDVRLNGATLGGNVILTHTSLNGDLYLDDCETESTEVTIDCTEAERVTGQLTTDKHGINYDFTRAELGHIAFSGERIFEASRLDRTRFDGFEFGEYASSLAERGWLLHDPSETDFSPEQLETLYLYAKNGANNMGETRIAAEFFVHEMRHRRQGYRSRLRQIRSLGSLVRNTSGWVGNSLLEITCGYGERPFRPVSASVLVVLLFALFYAALGQPIEYQEPLGYLIFSTEGFVSLILGLPTATSALVSSLLVLESFIGGFAIALFVFTLTRSISR